MSTVRKITHRKSAPWQAIVKDPRLQRSITRTFATKREATQYVKLVEGKLAVLKAQAMAEGEPHRVFNKYDVFPELKPADPEPDPACLNGIRRLREFAEGDYETWRTAHGVDRDKLSRPRQIQWWVDKLGENTPVAEITKGDIVRALDSFANGVAISGPHRGQRRALHTVDRQRAAISSLLTAAVDYEVIELNPAQAVKKRAKGPSMGTGRRLNSDERQRLLAAAQAQSAHPDGWARTHLVTHLAMTTAGRRGEILALRWRDIDLADLELSFREDTTKSGKTRTVPITTELRSELMMFRGKPDELVFPSPKRLNKPYDFRHQWRKTLEQAGIGKLRFHDLRHDGASRLANSGLPLPDVQRLLGHSSIEITMRYVHADEGATDRTREAIVRTLAG